MILTRWQELLRWLAHRNEEEIDESQHVSDIDNPASTKQEIAEHGGRTMVSVIVTADDCFGGDYIIDNDDIQGVLEFFSG